MSQTLQEWGEADYRKTIQQSFDRIQDAFDGVDPDVAECEQQLGALSILFADGTKCILSAQPSVRQLWLAIASKGTAFHFNYDAPSNRWIDDKGRGVELHTCLKKHIHETTGLELGI